MKKRINIATIVDKMQRATRHLVELCSHNIRYSLLLAVANSSLFTLHSSLLMGCSSDDETAPEMTSLEVSGYVSDFEEINGANKANRAYETNEAYGITRSWTPPTGYSIEEAMADKSISVFFTQITGEPVGGYEEEYFYKSSGKWRVSKKDLTNTTYYLYGYIPHEDYIEPSIRPLTGKTYADGAVLTLSDLNTVMASDLSIIIGAKNGPNADNDGGLKRGDFRYDAKPTTGDGKGSNYVYLLFDHLYAAIRFRMRVHGDYYALRDIKLKELSMQAFTTGESGDVSKPKKIDAVITLTANTTGGDPITSKVVFTPNGTDTGSGTFYTNEAGELLTTDYKIFQGSFMPENVNKVKLISRYDVYDKNGNLIRKDCSATNTLDLSQLFSGEARRGYRYTVNMIVTPTYLYMLSEPDLDNPTVKVE